MASMSDGYPFIFQMIDKCTENEYMLNTLQYRFKSTKSHHTYIVSKRLHDDVLHISKKPLRGELSGFLSIYQAEASCISPKVY